VDLLPAIWERGTACVCGARAISESLDPWSLHVRLPLLKSCF